MPPFSKPLTVRSESALAGPLASISYALVALVSVLTGSFQRHGGFIRPFVSVLAVVLLVAFGLTIDGLAARDNALITLIWGRTVLPGIVCAIVLFVPVRWRFRISARPSEPTAEAAAE